MMHKKLAYIEAIIGKHDDNCLKWSFQGNINPTNLN